MTRKARSHADERRSVARFFLVVTPNGVWQRERVAIPVTLPVAILVDASNEKQRETRIEMIKRTANEADPMEAPMTRIPRQLDYSLLAQSIEPSGIAVSEIQLRQ